MTTQTRPYLHHPSGSSSPSQPAPPPANILITDNTDGNSHLVNTYRTNYTSSWKLDSKEVDDGFFFCHNSVKVSAFLFHLAGILCHLFPSRRQYAESAVFPSSSSSGPVLLAHTDAANIDFRKVLTDSRRRDTCC